MTSKLYIVATPIGNLADITFRAIDVLKSVDQILAEDTRDSAVLLNHYGIHKPLLSLHEHNEQSRVDQIIALLDQGQSLALISDAGTPLISDPGARLVKILKQKGYEIIPIPGPSALIAALSASGLPTEQFQFLGFIPVKAAEKKTCFENLRFSNLTSIFYESKHRLLDTLKILSEILPDREISLAKELTKQFEQIQLGSPKEILAWLEQDPQRQKGEFVLLISPAVLPPSSEQSEQNQRRVLEVLLQKLSVKDAVAMAVEITGGNKNNLYRQALELGKS